jgi:hypothetical protein
MYFTELWAGVGHVLKLDFGCDEFRDGGVVAFIYLAVFLCWYSGECGVHIFYWTLGGGGGFSLYGFKIFFVLVVSVTWLFRLGFVFSFYLFDLLIVVLFDMFGLCWAASCMVLSFTIIQLGCKSLVSTLFMVYSDVQYYSIWRLYGICLEPKKYPYHTLWLTCDHLCPQNIFFCWRSDSMHTLLCVIDMAISFNIFLRYLHYFSELH